MAAATKADGDVQHTPILNGGSGDAPSLGPLLAQLQHSGLTLNKQQLAAAQALIRSRQQDQLRQAAFVCAMWGMSVIGGPLFFQQEMAALCQVREGVMGGGKEHHSGNACIGVYCVCVATHGLLKWCVGCLISGLTQPQPCVSYGDFSALPAGCSSWSLEARQQ